MRTLCLFVTLAVLLTAGAADARPTFGIQGGFTLGKIDMDDEDFADQSNITNPFGGVAVRFQSIPVIGWQIEAMYVPRGTDIEIPGGNHTVEYRLDYLDIGLLGRLAPPSGPMFSPYLTAGPVAMVSLGGDLNAADGTEYSLDDVAKSVGFALAVGGGAQVSLPRVKVWFDIRYCVPVSKVFDAGKWNALFEPIPGEQIAEDFGRHRTLMFLLGVGF